MSRGPTLIAYVLLTLLGLWAVADRLAPDRGAVSGCLLGTVYDGDTVELLCGPENRRARLQGFDTPETRRPRCAAEAALGKRATARLRTLVKAGRVEIFPLGRDRYGRDLVRLTVEGRDVGEVLIAEGLARAYRGGARGGWCE